MYIHIEAPDEMGHQGSYERKVQAIEQIDEKVIGPLVAELEAAGEDFRMLVLPDHPTPVRLRTHTPDSVPYMLYDSSAPLANEWDYTEEAAVASANVVEKGCEMIDILFAK